jgi:non-specific serine/threonine protein kinase/serine/threonine-protein kinase
VLLKACEAMAFAHDKGVIHRDLKPANVMVGAFGEVYVMDWGLARVAGHEDQHDLRMRPETGGDALEVDRRQDASGESTDALYTMDGDVIGTPSYMPPEQARGAVADLDARADVYSMGAMLYQLLGERPPYVDPESNTGPLEVLSTLLDAPPTPLEELALEVPGELVAICDKAMSREPQDRYGDMQALADDLRAYLENRVVGAYEAGALAEARKWIRRNKPLAISLAAGVLALVGGLVSSLVLKARADASAVLAEERRDEAARSAILAREAETLAEERRTEAENNAKLAASSAALAEARREEADASAQEAKRQERIAREVNRFLNDDLFASARSDTLGTDVTVREVLQEATKKLGRGRFRREPLVEAELRTTLGTTFDHLGLPEEARTNLERGAELYTQELGERAERSLYATSGFAGALLDLHQYDRALELYERLLRLYTEEIGAEEIPTLTTLQRMAEAHSAAGRLEKARELFESLIETAARVYGEDIPTVYLARRQLGRTLDALGDYDGAEAALSRAHEALLRIEGLRHWETLGAATDLVIVYLHEGRIEEALPLQLETLDLVREVMGPDHPDVAAGLGNLGVLYGEQGRLAESRKKHEEALDHLRRNRREDDPLVLNARDNLVAAYEREGRSTKALKLRHELIDDQRRVLGERHPRTLMSMNSLGIAYLEADRIDEAGELLGEVLELTEAVHGADHPDSLLVLENLGNVLFQQGDLERCLELLRRVLDGRRRTLGEDHPDVAKTLFNVAIVTRATGELEVAAGMFEDVLQRLRGSGHDVHPVAVLALTELAGMRLDTDAFAEAADLYRESARVRRALGQDDLGLGFVLHQLAYALFRLGDLDAAATAGAEALAFRRARNGSNDDGTLATLATLTRVLIDAGRYAEAEPLALEYHERATSGKNPGHADPDRPRALLVALYEGWGRTEDAERWR